MNNNSPLLLFVTTTTIRLGLKCPAPVMAFSAELTGIDLIHFDFNRPLFVLGKHVRIVALFAGDPGLLVNFS